MDSSYVTSLQNKTYRHQNIYAPLYIPDEGEVIDEEVKVVFEKPEKKVTKAQLKEINKEIRNERRQLRKEGWMPAKKYQRKNTIEEIKKRARKRHVNLWYNEESWQYKLVNDRYIFKETGQSVLDKYNIGDVAKMFKLARNNYKKNKAYHVMMNTVSVKEWDQIKDLVAERQ